MNQDELLQLQDNARAASTLLKAMSNEHRLLILCRLLGCERSVGELERVVGLSQSALSQHLARLRRDDLVKTRREAQTIYYSLKGDAVASVLSTLYDLYCATADDAHPDQTDDGSADTTSARRAEPMPARPPTALAVAPRR
ncbi:ArsR/SmtB family transcription factor [Roseospira visakhapatnamensis]|uniref:DNA-binding transcriptional ArsR family regulator n=1 Tax=Roseospira visakhapatnamensis TaxID=390880 RepID=A0A7W6RBK6_9PROT|nr:metalloregulator ArsR/SmtB family transcription factor [Roseospira visakhapatnamensis]MBB4264868.1 DNA-binding transcriptional ArsR family regulator [Roseospira visakhapatnamensis]